MNKYIEIVLAAAISVSISATIIATGNRIIEAVDNLDVTSSQSITEFAERVGDIALEGGYLDD